MEINDIGQIVRHHRKLGGLSQIQLATLAGTGKTVVFDIEKGKQTIQLETLLKICAVLNITFKLESPLMENYRALK